MNRYEELKNRFQQEINAFPMKWAFSKVDAGAWP